MTVKLLKGLISKEPQEVHAEKTASQPQSAVQQAQASTSRNVAQRNISAAVVSDAVVTNLRVSKSAEPAPKIREYDKARALADDVHGRILEDEDTASEAHVFGPTTGRDLLA